MKKKSFSLVLILIFSTIIYAQLQPQYGKWLFIQSDKALQYRIAVVKQVGDVASLQLQFRVNNEDEVYCKSARCNGMLLTLNNTNVGDAESTKYDFVFEKSFVGLNNIYTWPILITTELKTWPDGSKRFFSLKNGNIVYTLPNSTVEQPASVPYCCVDIILVGLPNEHRCIRSGFNYATAIHVK